MYQTLEFVRTLIMTYVHKHCSTQTHTLRVSMDTVEQAMRFAMTELKVETLKDKQKEAICSFVYGRDCFVILPTGYGKTLCYILLPGIYLTFIYDGWVGNWARVGYVNHGSYMSNVA